MNRGGSTRSSPSSPTKPRQRVGKARRRGRGLQAPQLGSLDGGRHDALRRERPDGANPGAGAPPDLLGQPAEAHDAGPEHGAGHRQLAAVVVDVGERGDDQDRLAVQGGPVGVQHDARLGGVGWTGDEGERHGGPSESQARPSP